MMRHLFKYGFSIVMLFTLLSVVSCNDPADLDEGTSDPMDPTEISIGFGLTLEPSTSSGPSAKSSSLEHNYATTGYSVDITGNLVNGDMSLVDVDLSEPILLEVTGSIVLTVKHPDFRNKKLGEVAYYGVKNVTVDTYEGGGLISVPLDLVQGFVSVTASDIMSNFIGKVEIGKDEVALNTIYYTNETKKEIEIVVEVFGGELTGQHDNVIGEGMVYEVTFSDAIGGMSKNRQPKKVEDLMLRSYSY